MQTKFVDNFATYLRSTGDIKNMEHPSVALAEGPDTGEVIPLGVDDLAERLAAEEAERKLKEDPLYKAKWDAEQARARASENVRRAAEATLARGLSGIDVVTLTLGVAQYAGSVSESLKLADVALYQGKEAGRNRVVAAPIASALAASGT